MYAQIIPVGHLKDFKSVENQCRGSFHFVSYSNIEKVNKIVEFSIELAKYTRFNYMMEVESEKFHYNFADLCKL